MGDRNTAQLLNGASMLSDVPHSLPYDDDSSSLKVFQNDILTAQSEAPGERAKLFAITPEIENKKNNNVKNRKQDDMKKKEFDDKQKEEGKNKRTSSPSQAENAKKKEE